jgi:UDP-N-acetylglucosamine--N-acetylmuramyl-(pentapeptide) pyrophosphoryl-undecaprenol N-acetylglucosamine transferase
MRVEKIKILISAGGTGGHIFPALAIAEEIRNRKYADDILFIGTKRGLEQKVIPSAGFTLKTIVMSGLARSMAPIDILKNIILPLKLLIGFIQSFWILCRFRPMAVVGCGGYVTGPVVWLGAMMNRLTFVQDQNSRPGRTTIFLSRWADRIYLAYGEARSFIRHPERSLICGNPLRSSIKSITRDNARKRFNLNLSCKTLLIVGGSLGAKTINQTILSNLDTLLNANDIQIIWQTGAAQYDSVRQSVRPDERVYLSAFIDSMPEAYSAADVILCRAGAMTLAEIACYGLPAILVPYPFAADNHQEYNAMTFANAGAAIMIRNQDLEHQFMDQFLLLIHDDLQLQAMSSAGMKLARPHAAQAIVDDINQFIQKRIQC